MEIHEKYDDWSNKKELTVKRNLQTRTVWCIIKLMVESFLLIAEQSLSSVATAETLNRVLHNSVSHHIPEDENEKYREEEERAKPDDKDERESQGMDDKPINE
ncbi:hypothetical protein HAX54_010981, partial [Datura stramonium]|nr:hypothetical protein [Datura stramonium]